MIKQKKKNKKVSRKHHQMTITADKNGSNANRASTAYMPMVC